MIFEMQNHIELMQFFKKTVVGYFSKHLQCKTEAVQCAFVSVISG